MTLALRPMATGQHLRWVQSKSTLHIDGYLHKTMDGTLTIEYQTRLGGKGEPVRYFLRVEWDMFGLPQIKFLYVEPRNLGQPVYVRELRSISAVQRKQLSRVIVLGALQIRAMTSHARHSTKLHCLVPEARGPFDGLKNHYGESAFAARDNLLKDIAARAGGNLND